MSTASGFRPAPRTQGSRALPTVEPLDFGRLGLAKSAHTTRFVSRLFDADRTVTL